MCVCSRSYWHIAVHFHKYSCSGFYSAHHWRLTVWTEPAKAAVGQPHQDWAESAKLAGAEEVKGCCRWPHGSAAAGCNSLEGRASDSQAVAADPSCTGGLCDLRQILIGVKKTIKRVLLTPRHCHINQKTYSLDIKNHKVSL